MTLLCLPFVDWGENLQVRKRSFPGKKIHHVQCTELHHPRREHGHRLSFIKKRLHLSSFKNTKQERLRTFEGSRYPDIWIFLCEGLLQLRAICIARPIED